MWPFRNYVAPRLGNYVALHLRTYVAPCLRNYVAIHLGDDVASRLGNYVVPLTSQKLGVSQSGYLSLSCIIIKLQTMINPLT